MTPVQSAKFQAFGVVVHCEDGIAFRRGEYRVEAEVTSAGVGLLRFYRGDSSEPLTWFDDDLMNVYSEGIRALGRVPCVWTRLSDAKES